MSSSTKSSSTVSSVNSRKHFDDRAQSLISISLRSHSAKIPEDDEIDRLRLRLKSLESTKKIINWSEAIQICKTLNSPKFISKFGLPTAIELSPSHILIGTSLGRVALFNYHQNLDFILELVSSDYDKTSKPVLLASPVTCVAISASGYFISAGHADGKVLVWEVSQKNTKSTVPDIVSPYDCIKSVSLRERAASSEISGHLQGVSINTVSFVGDSHQNIVTSDVSGLVLFHHGFQRLFRKKFASQRMLGYHVASSEDILDRFCVHDCQVLPIGTVSQFTDHIGLLAVITSNLLVIISICSLNNDSAAYPKTHYKATRPKQVYLEDGNSPLGCITWYPSIKGSKHEESPRGKNAKLAYSWNNVLTILEVDNSHIPENAMSIIADLKDKDRAIPDLELKRTARWTTPDEKQRILALRWLNSEILTALIYDATSAQTKLHFLYYKNSLQHVGTDDIDAQQVSWTDLSGDSTELELRFYNSSLRILRHRPVVLVDSHSECGKSLLSGTTSKWADRLVELISKKEFLAALVCAYDFYSSDNMGQLLLNGLPHTDEDRHAVVEPFLMDIMRESILPIFGVEGSEESTKENLWLYFHLIKICTKDRGRSTNTDIIDILQMVHEIVDDNCLYFDVLESFVLTRQIRTLPPEVFKCLVETYVEAEKGERLTEIICIMDSTSLNIDMTLKLCEAYGLRDCLIYIWTSILKDYRRPLFMLMADLDSDSLEEDQKKLVFNFMSYALSGRFFPTDDYMSKDEEDMARETICKVLFSLHKLEDSEHQVSLDTSLIFPYLSKFLLFSAFETLATLNEFFENPSLNTDAKGELNRQYVMEALIDIFRVNETRFSLQDSVHLAIFIARNYPKYFQFIRISDSVLEETVEVLCASPKECHSDAELALESLLPIYDVKNEEFFLDRIKAAHFYRVAFELSRSKQKYASALEIWIHQQKDESSYHKFSAFEDIVSHTFNNQTVSQTEKTRLLHIIEKNFNDLISKYTKDMVILANSHNVSIHQLVLQCQNEKLAFEYLEYLFEEINSSNFGFRKVDLLVKFIGLSCTYARDKLCTMVHQYFIEIKKFPDELESLKLKLRDEMCYDALAIISRNKGDYETSIQELKEGVLAATNSGQWANIDDLVTIGISICDKNKSCWPELVQTLVSLKEPMNSTSKVPDMINQNIYKCFRKIIDAGEKNNDPMFFTEILQGVMDQATLSQVRNVIQETFSSFYFDNEIHKITLSKLNLRIRKYMEDVKADRLRGFILRKKECDSCGKLMWGGEVLDRHIAAWESRETAKVFGRQFEEEQFKDCEISLFKCTHAYHSQCLERLGSVGQCVMCLR